MQHSRSFIFPELSGGDAIHCISLGAAWVRYLDYVISVGEEILDDKGPIIEAPPVIVSVTKIDSSDPLLQEWANLDIIDDYVSKTFSIDDVPRFGTSYGRYIFCGNSINYFDRSITKLRQNPRTKSASIYVGSNADHDEKFPCLNFLQPVIRQNSLVLNAVFRSQNALNFYANAIALSKLQKTMAQALNIETGKVLAYIICPHVYKADRSRIETILDGTIRRGNNTVSF